MSVLKFKSGSNWITIDFDGFIPIVDGAAQGSLSVDDPKEPILALRRAGKDGTDTFSMYIAESSGDFYIYDKTIQKNVLRINKSTGQVTTPVQPLPIDSGGTGATTASAALQNLGVMPSTMAQFRAFYTNGDLSLPSIGWTDTKGQSYFVYFTSTGMTFYNQTAQKALWTIKP